MPTPGLAATIGRGRLVSFLAEQKRETRARYRVGSRYQEGGEGGGGVGGGEGGGGGQAEGKSDNPSQGWGINCQNGCDSGF